MDTFENLPPAVTLVLAMLLVVWLVLLLLVPFMIESIRGWSRRSCQELEEVNRKLDMLTTLLGKRGEARREAPRAEPHADLDEELARELALHEPRAGGVRYADPPDERAARRRSERARKEPTI
jgi:hypothetical protein